MKQKKVIFESALRAKVYLCYCLGLCRNKNGCTNEYPSGEKPDFCVVGCEYLVTLKPAELSPVSFFLERVLKSKQQSPTPSDNCLESLKNQASGIRDEQFNNETE